MSQSKPTYEELKQRCQTAEAVLAAIRSGQTDMIIGDQGVLVLRLAEAEKALRLNRERLSLTLEAARAGTWEWDLKTNENFWSEELWPVYGLEPHCCQPSYEAWLQTIHPADRAGAAQAVQTAAANGTELNVEWRVLDPDGTERWLLSRGRPIRDAGGDVVRYIGIVFDITERKRTEVALRESEVRFRQIYEHMAVGIAQVSLDYRIEAANEAYCRMLGYDEEELVGKYLTDITHPETMAENLRRQAQLVTGEIDHYRMEKQFVHKKGRVVHGILDANLVRDAQGKPRYCLGSVLDITERRQAEDALRESEARYRLLAENMADVVWILNAHSLRFTYVSPSVERLRGYSVAEVMAQPIEQVMTPDSLVQVSAGLPERIRAFLGGDPAAVTQTHEVEQFRKDGSTVWTEVVTTLLRNEAGEIEVLGVSRDISARKQAEKASQLKSELLRLTGEMARVGGWEFDADTLQGTWTDEVARIHDLDPGQATHVELGISFYLPESRQKIEQALKEALELARPYDLELEMVSATGQPKWVRTMGLPISEGNRVIKVRGIFQDITERKRAEDELNRLNTELEQRVAERTAELSDLYNNAPCGYHSLDSNGVYVRINDTELAWLGYTREEIMGRVRFPDLLTPASLQTFAENFPVFKECGWVQDLEFDLVRKDGSILPVLLSASVIYDQAGRYLTSRSTMMDHTERRRAEVALRESQAQLVAANKELEAFAYSVSHDLRAPLRGIDGWSLALLEDYGEELDEAARQYLDRVRSEAQRMGRLIDDLLQLSRITRAEMHRSPVDLSTLAHTVVTRLREMEPERRVEVVIQPGLTASGDAALLEIVLTNLLGNALKFSSHRAEARVEFGCLPHASPPSPSRRGEGGEVYFVRDNGAGFDMAYAAKLFGAFQRMHKASEFPGTGIGLAIVQRIIHRHSGRVWVEAEVGRGAIFYFTLEEGL